MYITRITDDYDNITQYDNTTDTNNCNFDIIIPIIYNTLQSINFIFNIPYGIQFSQTFIH